MPSIQYADTHTTFTTLPLVDAYVHAHESDAFECVRQLVAIYYMEHRLMICFMRFFSTHKRSIAVVVAVDVFF